MLNKIKNRKVEYIIALIVFTLASVIFAYATGVIESGYHLTDDHEIIDICSQIKSYGFFNTLSYFVKDDLSWRFRPLFFARRVFRSLILGTNFYSWHLVIAIESGLYLAFSYILARKFNAPIISSIVFSVIFLIGSQDEIIWRMGTQENMGMFFLPLSLLLTYIYYESEKKSFAVMAALSTIMLMLSKESFLVLGPSVLLFLFYLYIKNANEDGNIFKKLWSYIKKYKFFIISICLVGLISFAIILFVVGLMESGYAGIDTNYTLGEYIRITLNVFIRDLTDYWIVFAIIVILFVYLIIKKKKENKLDKNYLEVLFVAFVLICYSIGIEALLYAKSAMFDRYKLPCIWVLFFALIVLENEVMNKYLNSILLVGLCLFYVFTFSNNYERSIIDDAKYYAKEGKNTTKMLNYIESIKDKYDNPIILTNFSWYEHDLSSSMYLQIQEGIEDVFELDNEREDGDYKKIFNNSDKRIYLSDANIVITDETNIDNYDLNQYNVNEFSSYYVLEKK